MAKIFAITGGPGTGKTSVVNELEKQGFRILKEAARWVSENDIRFRGKNILEINKKDFHEAIFDHQKFLLNFCGLKIPSGIFKFQKKQIIDNSGRYMTFSPEFSNKTISTENHTTHEIVYNKLKGDEIVFSDRGIGDTIAYYKLAGLKISEEKMEFARKFRYNKIFVLDFLSFYQKDKLRQESKKEQEKIHNEIIRTYEELGYSLIYVPFMSVKERVRFILERV